MDYRALLIAFSLCFSGAARAGYAQASPPDGWSGGSAATGGNATLNRAAANASNYVNGVSRASTVINVGGRAISVPVAMRLAANASNIAARAIYVNPLLALGVGVAAHLLANQLRYNPDTNTWESTDTDYPVSDGYDYIASVGPNNFVSSNPESACKSAIAFSGSSNMKDWTLTYSGSGMNCGFIATNGPYNNGMLYYLPLIRSGSSCPAGWYVTPAGCLQSPAGRPITQEEFFGRIGDKTMPDIVPNELPGVPLPVGPPVINPDTGVNPFPRPFFVPTGDPVKNPNYDPSKPLSPENQPYTQPGVRVVPSPTPDSPWRVDVQPVNRPAENPNPQPDLQPETNPDESNNDKPREDDMDLCQRNPDIIACQKLEKPEEVKLPTSEFDFNFTPEGGFSGAGVCPAPIVAVVSGRTLSFSWQPFCNSLEMLRPLILAFGWLSAVFILLGARAD